MTVSPDCEWLRTERNALRDALAALTHEYTRPVTDAAGVTYGGHCCDYDSTHPVHATPDVVLGDLR